MPLRNVELKCCRDPDSPASRSINSTLLHTQHKSRNNVPPFAVLNNPFLTSVAPVNAPFRWPKSYASTSWSGSAAQLISTKGFAARELLEWMARATSSLPVPVCPLMSTVMLVSATRLMI